MKEENKSKTAAIFLKTKTMDISCEKYKHRCILCGKTGNLTEVKKNAFFCRECIEEIKKV